MPQALLWDCLLSERDSAILNEFGSTLLKSEDDMADDLIPVTEALERNAVQIICLRREILHHIEHLMEQGRAELSEARLSSVLATIEQISPAMKMLRKNYPAGHESDGFPILCPSEAPLEAPSEAHASLSVVQMRSLLSAYYDVLAASIKSDCCLLTADTSAEPSESSESSAKIVLQARPLYEKLKVLSTQCEDAVLACHIIDLVSIVAFKSGATNINGCELSWAVLHTVYAGNSNVSLSDTGSCLAHHPPAFVSAIEKFTHAAAERADLAAALGALDKYASNCPRQMRENCVFRYSLLSHWGLSSLSGAPPCSDLKLLTESLRMCLDDIAQDIEGTARQTRRKKQPKKAEMRSREPTSDCLPIDIDIPALTAKSFPVFFEGLLHMIVASFALAKPGRGEVYQSKGAGNVVTSPYKQILDLSRVFRDLAEIFASRFKLFPRRTLTSVVRACAMVVRSCERQVLDCLKWRNAQPLLKHSDRDKGVVDLASSKFLQSLVDNIAYNCAGSAILFCDLIKVQAKKKHPDDEDKGCVYDDDDDEPYTDVVGINGENWAYASSHKAVANLLLRGEKLLDALRAICASYNLSPPRIRITRTEKVEATRGDPQAKDMRVAASATNQPPTRVYDLLASSLRRKSGGKETAAATSTSSKKERRRVTPEPIAVSFGASTANGERPSKPAGAEAKHGDGGIDNYNFESEKDEEEGGASDSEESLKSEDSFGVDGAWGGQDNDEKSNGSDEAPLPLCFVSST